MRKIHIVLILAAVFSTQPIFADNQNTSNISSSGSKSCATIVNACLAAGFVRTATPNKRFWQDCMKPIIMGQTVQGVTIDSATVKDCRINKINQLKKELEEFQKVS